MVHRNRQLSNYIKMTIKNLGRYSGLLFVCLMLNYTVYGQRHYISNRLENLNDLNRKKFSFGLQLGYNSYNYRFKMKPSFYEDEYRLNHEDLSNLLTHIESVNKTEEHPLRGLKIKNAQNPNAFNVGGLIKYRLNEYLQFSFEPAVHFGQLQQLEYWYYLFGIYPDRPSRDLKPEMIIKLADKQLLDLKTNVITFPLLAEFGISRINNLRPYFSGGLSLNIFLDTEFQENNGGIIEGFDRKKLGFNYEVGLGVDFFFYRFRITPSLRWSISAIDYLASSSHEYYTSELKGIGVSAFLFNIGLSPY